MRKGILITALLVVCGAARAFDASPLLPWVAESVDAFDPLSISGCNLWLDAAAADTISADGNSVTNWTDKSTAGNNAVSIGAENTRPTRFPSEQNNLCAVGFDGGDYLATDYMSSATQTVFIVAKLTGGEAIMGSRDTTSTRSFFGSYITTEGRALRASIGTDSLGRRSTTNQWDNSYHIFSAWYDGATVSKRFDGAEDESFAQSGSGDNTVRGYYIGALNDRGVPAIYFVGYIGEILIYQSVLSPGEIGKIESYLLRKWGL